MPEGTAAAEWLRARQVMPGRGLAVVDTDSSDIVCHGSSYATRVCDFLDFREAVDCVHWSTAGHTLEGQCMPSHIVEVVRRLYDTSIAVNSLPQRPNRITVRIKSKFI